MLLAFNSLLVFFVVFCPVNSYGNIYKCTDANGLAVYSDTACDTNARRQAIDMPPKQAATDTSFFSVLAEKINAFIKGFTNGSPLNSELSGGGLAPPQTYECDGRTRCPQMTSCDEARFFIKHCPNAEMDGDNDGTPCESQWCR